MSKWYGVIGFADEKETVPGVWEPNDVVERHYYGDLIRNTRLVQQASQVIDNINVSNQISILADPYANQHIFAMRYAEFQGTKWTVSNVEVQYPRLLLTLGGVYNG